MNQTPDISLLTMLDTFRGGLATAFGDKQEAPPFHEWVKDITLDGKPFTYERHEYLIEPYQDDHPYIIDMKGTQMCLTSKAMLKYHTKLVMAALNTEVFFTISPLKRMCLNSLRADLTPSLMIILTP